jgi:hypothetical protein
MNLSSKFTLYDMFAMVIPGFLLLMLFPFCCDCYFNLFADGTGIVCAFIASYLIGLIYHKAVEYLFTRAGCRNDKNRIKAMGKKFYSDYNDRIKDAPNVENAKDIQYDTNSYYKAYYKLMKNGMLYNIPTLEAQVVFIRNILPITLFYIIVLCCRKHNISGIDNCISAIGLLIIAVILFLLLNNIQDRIFYLIEVSHHY